MDPIAILQSRIEQLEAKLGLDSGMPSPEGQQGQQGDSATANLLNAHSAINNATVGHEKLQEAMHMASELNNYTDPNLVENMQQNNMHMQEVAANESVIRHHCHCMHRCQQGAPVLESEAIAEVPQMQQEVNNMHAAAAEVKAEADYVAQGVQQLAETCGTAATEASQQLADIAQNVEQVQEKKFPTRRNGLD